jgi:hypothetical protein
VAVAAVFLARSGEVDFSRFFFVDILFEQKAQEKERKQLWLREWILDSRDSVASSQQMSFFR